MILLRILPQLAAVVPLGCLGAAATNKASGDDSRAAVVQYGAQLFQENCTTCHDTKPPYNPAKLDTIKNHMHEQVADLSLEDREAILASLESNSANEN